MSLSMEAALKRWMDIAPLQPIRSRVAYRKYMSILKQCLILAEDDSYSEKTLSAARDYAKVLSLILEDYEKNKFKLPKASQADLLKFLIQRHHLTQTDLKKELGGQPAVSNVLNGKRKLNVRQIEKLSGKFHLSPAVFFTNLPPVS